MAGSVEGAALRTARRHGMGLDEYRVHLLANKWCTSCKAWHPRSAFGKDRSRHDGLSTECVLSCVVSVGRPGLCERRQAAQNGKSWCRRCSDWAALDSVYAGLCRFHAAEAGREYYAKTPALRAAKRERRTKVPQWWREDRFEEFGGLCAYGCGNQATTLDHVWPVARGGEAEPANLVPACARCNSKKRAGLPDRWIDMGVTAFPYQWADLIALAANHGFCMEEALGG